MSTRALTNDLPRDGSFRLASRSTATVLGGIFVALLVPAVALTIVTRDPWPTNDGFTLLLMVAFAAVGSVVARREPRNAVGWLFVLVAVLTTLDCSVRSYLVLDYRQHGGRLAGGAAAFSWESTWTLLPIILAMPTILLFPDGRIRSQMWRRLLFAYIGLGTIFMATQVMSQIGMHIGQHPAIDSRGTPTAAGATGVAAVGWVGVPVLLLLWLAFVGHQVNRWRCATGVARAQLKWLMTGAAICVVSCVALVVGGNGTTLTHRAIADCSLAGICALPVAFGVGILRYRLYEIDRLISRTVSYTIITGLLAGVFTGIVFLTTDVLPFSSPVGVAASTLASAALFSPLRRRVQRAVDKRFNRSRYDVDAILVSFSSRLRGAIDPDAVHDELLRAVDGAIQPTHASLWVARSRPAR